LDLLTFEAIAHSKFSFPIPIQLASAYSRVEAINSTQKQFERNAQEKKQRNRFLHGSAVTNKFVSHNQN